MPDEVPSFNLPRVLTLFLAVIATFILAVAVAIGGSYLLTLHSIHEQEQAAVQLRAREAVANLRSVAPECEALIALDNARVGAIFPKYGNGSAASSAKGYGYRLAVQIHNVVTQGGCYTIVDGLKDHKTLAEIQKELNAEHR